MMPFWEYLWKVTLGTAAAFMVIQTCRFILAAIRRWRYNRQQTRFRETIDRAHQAFMKFVTPKKRKAA